MDRLVIWHCRWCWLCRFIGTAALSIAVAGAVAVTTGHVGLPLRLIGVCLRPVLRT